MDSESNEGSHPTSEFTARWSKFRDALRHEDQLVWDEMFQAVEIHRDANDFEKQFMAMMIEQRRVEDEVEKRLVTLEEKINAS